MNILDLLEKEYIIFIYFPPQHQNIIIDNLLTWLSPYFLWFIWNKYQTESAFTALMKIGSDVIKYKK